MSPDLYEMAPLHTCVSGLARFFVAAIRIKKRQALETSLRYSVEENRYSWGKMQRLIESERVCEKQQNYYISM